LIAHTAMGRRWRQIRVVNRVRVRVAVLLVHVCQRP
jgi:hypothetical protein